MAPRLVWKAGGEPSTGSTLPPFGRPTALISLAVKGTSFATLESMGRVILALIVLTACTDAKVSTEESAVSSYNPGEPKHVFLDNPGYPEGLSWDGRVSANMIQTGAGGEPASMTVPPTDGRILFRPMAYHPDRVRNAADGRFAIRSFGEDHGAYLKNIDGSELNLGSDRIKTLLNGQMAFSMDPTISDSVANPAPCKIGDSSFQNGECYRGVLYMPLSPDEGPMHQIFAARVFVRVIAFDEQKKRLVEPKVSEARLQSYIVPLRTVSGDIVAGAELSATADGRLLYSKSAQYNFKENAANFFEWAQSFSDPIDWFKLHEATRGVSFRGQPFEEHYPIAKEPIRNLRGLPCDRILCGSDYPWISQGGEDLFFSQTMDGRPNGALRGGYTMVGANTRYQMVVLDMPFNRDRMLGPGRTTGPGLYPSMWTHFDEFEPHRKLLPQHKDELVYLNTGMGAKGLAEIPLRELVDDNYLLYLHMNEFVRRRLSGESHGDELIEGGKDNARYLKWLTPDTSGHMNNAIKDGAAFFDEDVEANRDQLLGSVPSFTGKSMYFAYGSTLSVPATPTNEVNPAGDAALHSPLPFATFQFAIKLIRPLAHEVGIFVKGKDWRMLLLQTGEIVFEGSSLVGGIETPFRWETGLKLTDGDFWTHVTLTVKRSTATQMRAELYLHGGGKQEIATNDFPGVRLTGSQTNLRIGPAAKTQIASTGTGMVYALDEFSVSKVARSLEEITRVARHKAMTFSSTVAIGQLFDTIDGLRSGLDIKYSDLPSLMRQRLEAPGAGHNPSLLRIPYAVAYQVLFGGRGTSRADDYVSLGRQIFNDVDLTGIGIGCVTCHDPSVGFIDPIGESTSIGAEGPLTRNTPGLLNRAFSAGQFWDQRSANLVQQAWLPIENPKEMAGTPSEVLKYLRNDAPYKDAFAKIGVELTDATDDALRGEVALALATFQMALLSGANKIDAAKDGVDLSYGLGTMPEELQSRVTLGKTLFFGKARCSSCHFGPNLTDELMHNTGTTSLSTETCTNAIDWGRFDVSRGQGDIGYFKTPSLRFVASTGPYLHHGCVNTLEEVVDIYNQGGVTNAAGKKSVDLRPLGLTATEKTNLVLFLKQL